MELTDSKLIDALKGEGQRRRRRRRRGQTTTSVDAKPTRQQRCLCGTCTTCIDNARWEAIFNAKFADPDYYKSRPVRGASSLDWMRPPGRTSLIRSIER